MNVNNVLDPFKVDRALRLIISDLDYDLHKNLESDEETGTDVYPAIASAFIRHYNKTETRN